MPRTPAPLTVEYAPDATIIGCWSGARLWMVLSHAENQQYPRIIASFEEEADARAFVALPALRTQIQALSHQLADEPGFVLGMSVMQLADYVSNTLDAALAQADGPKEQP